MKKYYISILLFLNLFSLPVKAGNETLETTCNLFPLPGRLNEIPVANSNSPEVVTTEGILLSTFPPDGKEYPEAHLDFAFNGNFDIFSHHIAVERNKGEFFDLWQGIILYNPSEKTVKLKVHTAATYVSQPDAPFVKLEKSLANPESKIYAGPGDRVNQDVLRQKNNLLAKEVEIAPGSYYQLFNAKIPIQTLTPPVNGRNLLFKLTSDGPLYLADLATHNQQENYRKPTLERWREILEKGKLAERRDKKPTQLGQKTNGQFFYGRVSGVSAGNKWLAEFPSSPLSAEKPCQAYVLNTVYNNTLSTNQVQSAEMLKRYEDTAYQAHANYGTSYELKIPVSNPSGDLLRFELFWESPLRIPEGSTTDKLKFYQNPPEKINFRGEVKLNYESFLGYPREEYLHLVQRFGEGGNQILSLLLLPGETKMVNISYIYPADATPPHVLTVRTRKIFP